MEQKTKIGLGILGVVFLGIILIVVFGDSWDEAAAKQKVLTEQAMKEDALKEQQNINNCPKKGTFDSGWSYYIKLCMYGKKDSQLNQDQCEKLADTLDYHGDIDSAISNQLCKKCGQCTEEQLKEMNVSNGVEG